MGVSHLFIDPPPSAKHALLEYECTIIGQYRVNPFTRDCLLGGCCARINHPYHHPRPPAFPTLVQYECTIIGQYTTPQPTARLHAMHHTILVITISCKAQAVRRPAVAPRWERRPQRHSGGGGPARKAAIGSRRRLPPQAPRYIQWSSP